MNNMKLTLLNYNPFHHHEWSNLSSPDWNTTGFPSGGFASSLMTGKDVRFTQPWMITAALVAICVIHFSTAWKSKLKFWDVPVVGTRSAFEPQFLISWRFFRNAASVLNDGYAKFSEKVWRFNRADTDMLMMPPKYVSELRTLPLHVASPTAAHAFNLAGHYTNMDIILKNNLHFRTLQEKLTPHLGQLTQPMQEELEHAIKLELPACDNEWVGIKPYYNILSLVARISARIFLGLPLCRSKEWLEISTQFTENTFISLVVLRVFPTWLHGALSYMLPSVWKATNYIKRAQKLLTPEIRRRRADMIAGKKVAEDATLLSWMIEIASEEESIPEDLAHLEVVISLASIHTSHMNAVHVLYDLAAHPEYMDILREEIETIITEDGPISTWDKTSYSKLKKLDSFMRESQRFNPPTLLSYHRVMLHDHVLSDGTLLPKGAHIAMPVNAIQNDPEVTPSPETFDPLRYYNLRQREGEGHLHQFATTESRILNFGHGRYACPGRFFAALEIKCIVVKLLMDYDWRLPAGQGRPANLSAHEFVFPNQEAILEMKRR